MKHVSFSPARPGGFAYSGPLVAWTECAEPAEWGECSDEDPTVEVFYALPEPVAGGAAAALLALGALASARARRRPAGVPPRHR